MRLVYAALQYRNYGIYGTTSVAITSVYYSWLIESGGWGGGGGPASIYDLLQSTDCIPLRGLQFIQCSIADHICIPPPPVTCFRFTLN